MKNKWMKAIRTLTSSSSSNSVSAPSNEQPTFGNMATAAETTAPLNAELEKWVQIHTETFFDLICVCVFSVLIVAQCRTEPNRDKKV